ncbi:MAG: amphi-Trp domain-containing protein [Desulfovibrionaceae bacterium]|nr:amphi-Trp domain-containing protein [Desulfovibrionaceae bacterium]MBF0514330.1 amphi-Trp domain-containing protein [Desulfovibrionaceae bacterium]
MSKCEMSLKGNVDFAGAIALLGDIVKSFKDKTVCIQKGGEFVTLNPVEPIAFEIEAQRKKGKQKLSIELSWFEETAIEAPGEFTVSSKEPELPAGMVAVAPGAACESGKKGKDAKKQGE